MLLDIPNQVAQLMSVVFAMISQLLLELANLGDWVLKGIFPRLEGQRIRAFVCHGVVFHVHHGGLCG